MIEPLDLELSLHRAAGGGYAAEVRLRLGDDAELLFGPLPVGLDPGSLPQAPGLYGAALASGVFNEPRILAGYVEARARAASQGAALRVRLHILPEVEELHSLAWERMLDPETSLPLCLNEKVLFSRYLPPRAGAAASQPPKRASLRVLAAAANPANLSAYQLAKIDIVKELSRAETFLAPLRVERLPQAAGDLCTLNRLIERTRSADILYLACHGAYRRKIAALFLEGEDGKVKRAVGSDLAARLAQVEQLPRLVVLASCDSAGSSAGDAFRALGPLLVEAGVPAVLAVQGPVAMETMDAFLPVLFRELAQDGRIDRAVARARQAVTERVDWWAPVLFMNLLSGRLWEPEDDSITRIPPAGVPHEVPAPPANFIGRAAELAEMVAAVERGVQVINLHGTSGVGRTAAARELVRRVIARFPDGQVNLDMQGANARSGLAGAISSAQALAYVIQKFDPTITQLPPEELFLRGRLQSLLFGRRVLILMDNVADILQVAAFLPPPEGCLVLLTSWERFESEDAQVYNRLLGKLDPKDAERLLVALAPRAAPRAAELAARCEYLPQALDGIARRLNKSQGLSIDDLLILLDDVEARLEITGVSATLQVSYEMLTDSQKKDWRRLSVFSADFDVSAAAWVWGRVDAATPPDRLRSRIIRARLDLEDLLGFGLVEFNPASDRYQLHNLERAFAAGLEEMDNPERTAIRLAHARFYLDVLRRANALYLQGSQRILDGLALFDREVGEVRAAWAWLQPGSESETPERLELRAAYPAAFLGLMAVRLMPDERARWLEGGLQAARESGDGRLGSLLLSSLGAAYNLLDRHEDALACLVESLQDGLAEARRPGGSCDGLVYALGNLGALYRASHRKQRAARYLTRQLDLARRGELHREEGRALGMLGRIYLDLGELDRAIECFETELEITAQTGDRRARAIALGGLGEVYRVLKDFDQAQAYLEEDLAITREIGDRRGHAIASWMLGKVFTDMGDLEKAIERMQVLVDYEKETGHQDARRHSEKIADLQAKMRE